MPTSGAHLSFDLFLDTEETDTLALQRSADGGATWSALPFTTRDRGETSTSDGVVSGSGDRRWAQARADLPSGSQLVRWTYTTDPGYLGRGVYVDDVQVRARGGSVFDGERSADAFASDGWTLRDR